MTFINANIKKLYLFSFLKMSLFPMAIITLFWKDHIGLSLTKILLLQGIYSVAMIIMEYPSGYLGDRIGYRTALNLASLLGIIGWGLYSFADSFALVLMAEIILGISLSFISGCDSALLYESLKADNQEQHYARHEGRINGLGQIGEACGAIFAGLLYATAPLLPFMIQVAVWVLALLLTRTLIEPPRQLKLSTSHFAEALQSIRHAFLENLRLRSMILLNLILGMASYYPIWLIQPYMQDGGVPIAWFGPIWALANLSIAISALVSYRSHLKMGDRQMVRLFILLIVAGYLGLGLVGGVWGFLFYYLLTIMRGLRGPMLLNHVQQEIPSGNRAGILSLQSFVFRISFVCTGPLVGRFADTVGVRQTFLLLCGAFALILIPVARLFFRQVIPRKFN
ncbi:permease of the major facilitator superfamily [Desulforapulum autotrophicum HRM2]|uniref:Permease of the major facilitator superfamily n=1 Tax=Desulforapulum autotrophicum (strain ATCC 43914 / DSM 3382 / VKM B-1955 / HRM2) TaxID=177437 RepID=C0QC44_DESAH|nr:MFS transporter [Desulforapulum autotrophicum]ACN17061.1 permease of the major facilitator superfamily [Desulforapulum autotrophicum HRM2]